MRLTYTAKLALLLAFFSLIITQKAEACHAIALVNINQQNLIAGGIQVTAASDSPTCGCDEYWLDVEVRCMNEPFDGAPFAPGFHGPLATYPYFQSAQMLKPNCAVVNYPWVTIPYTSLCPGMTYQYRMRENHNGQVGPWSAAQTFVVPGATQPLVAAAGASQTVICAGACVNLTSSVAQGCELAATYTWDNGIGVVQNPTNICPPATTTYCVTIVEQCSGFTDQACVTVNVVPPPVNGTAAVAPANFCTTANPVLSLTGHSGTIQWQSAPNAGGPWTNLGGGTTTPFNAPQISATTCYRAEITGCGVSGPTILYSNVICVTQVTPNPPTMVGNDETCDGLDNGSATATPDPVMTAPISYSWNTVPVQTTQTATGLAPGTYTVNITDANGCTATNTVTIAPGIIVNAGFTPPANQCLTGNNFSFTNTGTAGVTYSWNFGDGNTSTQQNPSHSYATAGTYTVTQIVSNPPCADTVTASITVYPMPAPTAFADSVLCNGDATGSATVNTPIGPGPGPFGFSWNSAPVQTTNPASNLPAGTYTVTVTDQTTNCTGQATVTVFEPPLLTANENHVNPTCNGYSDGTATANPTGGTPGYTYSWNTIPVQNTQTATGLAAGTYTCTITDGNNCQTTVNATLIDPPGMVLNPTMVQSNCGQPDGSASVNVVSGGTGPYTYSWNTAPVQTTQTASNIPAGTYTVTVVDQSTGCSADTVITVTTTAGLTASTTLINDALCNGATNGTAYAAPVGGTAPFTYSWNTTPVQTNDTVTAGIGTYTVTITDSNGCTASAQVNIGEPTPVTASITGSTDVSCIGGNDGTATAGGNGGTPGYTYSWNTTPVQNTQTATGLAAGTYTVTVSDLNNCTDTISVTIIDGAVLTSSVVGVDVSCFGGNDGSADLTVNGGTAPYTYNWTPSGSASEDPNGLTAGWHFVTVTSQEGCIITDSILINEPTQLVASIDAFNDVTCFGGSDGGATAGGLGGTAPYTYSWNTTPVQTTASVTNLPFGSYTVTVTDSNGCTATANVNINQPPALAATVGNIDAYCSLDQGSVWVNPTNGTAPYTYVWDSATVAIGTTDTINNLYPGTYNVTVTDSNGCKFNGTATINALPGGTANISTSTNVSCNGGNDGTATVSVGGAFPGFTYLWDANAGNQTTNPATGLAAGNYSVTVTDTLGCVMTTNVTITEPTPLNLAFNPNDNVCPDSCNATITASVAGGVFPYSFSWNDPGLQITGTATGLCSGMYTVIVTDSNGCIISDSALVTEPPAMVIGNNVTPANCNQSDGAASAFVIANGVAPFTYQWDDGVNPLGTGQNLNNVPAGTYYVTVTDSNGCSVIDSVTVPNLSGPTIALDSLYHVQCFGGNDGYAEVQVTGGTFPYTYAWNTTPVQTTPSASNLTAGNYTVTATDSNGCVVSTSVTITEPTQLQLTTGGVDPTCFSYSDGSIWVNAFGGTTPYSYSWNTVPPQATDSVNGLPAGTYTVTVVDSNGCFDTANVTLVDPLQFSLLVTGNNVTCNGACDGNAIANLTNGIAPFSYAWDDPNAQTTDSIFGLCDTTFNVVVTDAMGCTATGSITITEPDSLIMTENLHGDVSCSGGNDGFSDVNIIGGTGPYNFNWDLNGTSVSTNQSANNLVAGSYLVTVTDSNGCTDQITVVITEPNPLAASTTTVDADCFGAATGSAHVSILGGTAPYSIQWNDPGLQQTDTAFNLVANTNPGYSVTVTDSLGCTITLNNIIINEPTPLVLNATTVSSTCGSNNGSATVNVGGGTPNYNYSWNTTPVQGTATANNIVAGSYTVIVTDANGCVDSIAANVTDLGSPTVTIPTSTDVSCNGANDGTAQSVVVGGTAPYSYLWNTGNPGDTLANVTGLAGQTYSVTVTDSNGCIASASVTIIENSGLSAAINASTNASCNGATDGTASVIGGGGGAPYTYSWNTAPVQTTANATGLGAGTYIVTISDTNNCMASDTIIITEPALLTVSQDSLSDVKCNGGSDGYLDVIVGGGTPGYSYAWTPNVSTGATAAGLTAGNYSVTVTDANNCTVTGNYAVAEPPQLVVDTVTTPSTCGQPNGIAEVNIVTHSTPAYTYLWNTNPNQTTAIATNIPSGNYTVVVTDANGCSVTQNVSVGNLPGPIIDSVTTTPVGCFGGNNGTATVHASGNAPFSYSWDDPFLQTGQTATGLSASPPVYTVIVRDANNCTSTAVATVVEPGPLSAIINSPDTICYGETIQLFANANQGTPAYNFLWWNNQVGSGPIVVSPITTTTYSVDVSDANGCQASTTKTVVVRAKPQFSVDGITICEGETATITPYNITGGNANNPFQFSWMVVDSLTMTYSSTGVMNPTNPLIVSPVDTTDYIVWVDDGCSEMDTLGFTINVNDTATGQLVPVRDTCQGFSQSFALTSVGGVSYGWDFDGDGIIDQTTTSTTTNYTYAAAGTYNVIVTITTAEGCVSMIHEDNWVTVNPNPIADFLTNPNPAVVTLLNPEFDFIDQSFDAVSWNWDFDDLSTSTTQNPTHLYQDTGFYDVQLIVSNSFGCYDTIVKTVRIKPEFFFAIPNSITPNGDGMNDVFMPGAMIGALDHDYNFYIFDRWGELIYEGHDLDDGWDGTYKGSLVQTGTYVWVIHVWDLQGVLHKYTGHVNVLK